MYSLLWFHLQSQKASLVQSKCVMLYCGSLFLPHTNTRRTEKNCMCFYFFCCEMLCSHWIYATEREFDASKHDCCVQGDLQLGGVRRSCGCVSRSKLLVKNTLFIVYLLCTQKGRAVLLLGKKKMYIGQLSQLFITYLWVVASLEGRSEAEELRGLVRSTEEQLGFIQPVNIVINSLIVIACIYLVMSVRWNFLRSACQRWLQQVSAVRPFVSV